jgi:GntR family transcriptional repressor for pyruvate dehydrogenase complex
VVARKQTFKRLETAPVYRLVYDAIEQQIVNGELKPGVLLPTETHLAEQFGVNRSTVREGIRMLEESGLVQRKSGQRLQVTIPHLDATAARTSRLLRLHEVTFRELWEASIAIEPVVARYAAERISADELQKLEENIAEMESASNNHVEVVRLDIEFHNIIAQAARNKALMLAREPISKLFMPAGKAILPRLKTQKRIIDAHHALLKALRARDADEATSWMHRHIADFKRGFEQTGLDIEKPLESV